MKRKLFVLLTLLALLCCLSAAVFAETPVRQLTVSDDKSQVELDGKVYVRANIFVLEGGYYELNTVATIADEEQYSSITVKSNSAIIGNTGVLRISYTYTDGTKLEIGYIREDLQGALQELQTQEQYIVEFPYPYGNSLAAKKNQLWGETLDIPGKKYTTYSSAAVYARHKATGMMIVKGEVIAMDDAFYYAELAENGVTEIYDLYDSNSSVTVHKVTDPELISTLNTALDRYYEDSYGWLEDPDVGDSVSDYSIIILFALFPAAALAVFAFLAIRSKQKIYRRLCCIVCGCALLVLAVLLSLMLAF